MKTKPFELREKRSRKKSKPRVARIYSGAKRYLPLVANASTFGAVALGIAGFFYTIKPAFDRESMRRQTEVLQEEMRVLMVNEFLVDLSICLRANTHISGYAVEAMLGCVSAKSINESRRIQRLTNHEKSIIQITVMEAVRPRIREREGAYIESLRLEKESSEAFERLLDQVRAPGSYEQRLATIKEWDQRNYEHLKSKGRIGDGMRGIFDPQSGALAFIRQRLADRLSMPSLLTAEESDPMPIRP